MQERNTMSNNRNWYHVTHRSDGKWAVIKEGAERAAALFDTQAEAEDYAKELARKAQSEELTHNRENKIRDRSSYGKDVCPPRG